MATSAVQPPDPDPVEAKIREIKAYMPNVYRGIQARAREAGMSVFGLARRGLRGEPNCFYAFEAGRVVGTPFTMDGVMDDVAIGLVRFGASHVLILSDPPGPEVEA